MVRTGKDWSGLVRTGPDWSGQDRSGCERSGLVRTGQDMTRWVSACQGRSWWVRTRGVDIFPFMPIFSISLMILLQVWGLAPCSIGNTSKVFTTLSVSWSVIGNGLSLPRNLVCWLAEGVSPIRRC